MRLKGISHWAFGFGLAIASSAFASQNMAIKKINLPRFPESSASANQLPLRDAPLRIAALRVEFVPDTLTTTTGDGSFDYGANDSFYFDPPPHDSLYFADQLQFQNFYWDKVSAGNVTFNWDIFPAGSQASYRLPKQMWQYNYNNGAAQLDKGLAELFRDAVQVADSDAAIVWNNYDLVIIFHAGAGAEFDLGFSSTPHDLPSAWMVKEDFRSQLNLPNGIPVDNNTGFVSSGIILPETETHEGVQISMTGVVSLMIGHWMGLPALYDRDDGNPVVGKWSMMDRGFGNFYGALPGPVDAWSANHMGWMTLPEASTGGNEIFARYYDGPEAQPLSPRGYRIPVSNQEEFILECRYRDPEADSVAHAWDRDGRMMTFHDDYSVTVEPGFRVPVTADDLDFDSPGSGILIWHHDVGLDGLIAQGRFNSVNEIRGLDLEEADGAQDIGRNYPILTPGYGTDYGIYEDAWYGDNSAYKDANQYRNVSFNDDSYPNSRSNSGAYTHVKVDSISRRGWQMGFRFQNKEQLFQIAEVEESATLLGNFSGDAGNLELICFSDDSLRVFNLKGQPIYSQELPPGVSKPRYEEIVSRDLNEDGLCDLAWISSDNDLVGAMSDIAEFNISLISNFGDFLSLSIGGRNVSTVLAANAMGGNGVLYHFRFDREFALIRQSEIPQNGIVPNEALARIGSVDSDSFLVADRHRIYLSTGTGASFVGDLPNEFGDVEVRMSGISVADFDGSGYQDIVIEGIKDNDDRLISDRFAVLFADILSPERPAPILVARNNEPFDPVIPLDADFDGKPDVFGSWSPPPIPLASLPTEVKLFAYAHNGALIESYPKSSIGSPLASLRLADDIWLFITADKHAVDARLSNGTSLRGFPLAIEDVVSVRFAEIDTVRGYDLIVANAEGVNAWSMPTSNYGNQTIWFEGPYRDNDHSNAVWEPATPFSPASGADLLEDNHCYNWPNPARGETTAIRYTLNFPATVSVEIFDIAGDKVASLSGPGEAGVPNEITWNLKNVSRGAYLAIVKADGAGKSQRKTVKIAVVK